MVKIELRPIGVIRTPFKKPQGTPIQPPAGRDHVGTVEVLPEYEEGLKDLEGFSHIILVYHFHLSKETPLTVRPFMDNVDHGVFATRAPSRPNPIGVSTVRLEKVEGNILHIRDVDIVDGTPLLDIKPYTPEFEEREGVRIGWLEGNIDRLPRTRDDGRFIE
jgi:tRNA-Thr(GGU) m(6)t(6)A37 methyltransferase TsaA